MSFLTGLRPEFDSLRCQFLNESDFPSLRDTFARVLRNETLQSPHTLAPNSALLTETCLHRLLHLLESSHTNTTTIRRHHRTPPPQKPKHHRNPPSTIPPPPPEMPRTTTTKRVFHVLRCYLAGKSRRRGRRCRRILLMPPPEFVAIAGAEYHQPTTMHDFEFLWIHIILLELHLIVYVNNLSPLRLCLKQMVCQAYLISHEKGLQFLIRSILEMAKEPSPLCRLVSASTNATPALGRYPPFKRELKVMADDCLRDLLGKSSLLPNKPVVYITFTSLPVSEEQKEDTSVKEEAGTTDTVVEETKEETTNVLRCSSYTVWVS
ncbi:dynamin-2B [Artemisia annua]|uniref:Dynamin-2B n=1 Tax=Artemisia annua TaxID=35608 RepID=A0A2U1LWY3_ARTAN|nr:dynamin-2B [Artemisia annua]